jgi:hypothetical protein
VSRFRRNKFALQGSKIIGYKFEILEVPTSFGCTVSQFGLTWVLVALISSFPPPPTHTHIFIIHNLQNLQ